MYRPPGRDEYINIVEAFDELYNKLECIEAKLNNMELNNVNANETVRKH